MVPYYRRRGAWRICSPAVVRPGLHHDELSARKGQGQGVRRLLGHLPVWLVHRIHYRSCNQHSLRQAQRRVNLNVLGNPIFAILNFKSRVLIPG